MIPSEFNLVFELINSLGPVGFIFWLVWRTTNRTIPRIVKNNEERIKDQRDDFLRESKIMREDFISVMSQQRDFFKEQIEREREIYQGQTTQVVDALKELKSEIRNVVG
jgi:hypothetical protein